MILKSLSVQEMHGLGISRRITQITQGTFQVKKRWGRISLAIARALEAS
jgi:DNA-binding PadR family transcriptional regulator